MNYITYNQLLGNNIHIGNIYTKGLKMHNNMILGIRKGYLILNLEYTLFYFRKLNFFFKELILIKGIFLVASINLITLNFSADILQNSKYLTYFIGKWPGGLFTNFKSLRNRLMINQNITRLKRLPDALFLIDNSNNNAILLETKKLLIPNFSLVNGKIFKNIDYPLLGNNSSIYSIKFYIYLFIYLITLNQVEQRIISNYLE